MDPAHLADLPVIGSGATWTLHREPALMVLRFHGEIDDDASAAWRAVAQKSFDESGFPRHAFVDPTDGHATTTLRSRMKTAAFLRHTATHVERVTIATSTSSSFVIRTILRAAGVDNVALIDVADAPAALRTIRAR